MPSFVSCRFYLIGPGNRSKVSDGGVLNVASINDERRARSRTNGGLLADAIAPAVSGTRKRTSGAGQGSRNLNGRLCQCTHGLCVTHHQAPDNVHQVTFHNTWLIRSRTCHYRVLFALPSHSSLKQAARGHQIKGSSERHKNALLCRRVLCRTALLRCCRRSSRCSARS